MLETQDPKTLTFNDEYNRIRVQISQEYANEGLEILNNKLSGVIDYWGAILLLINSERDQGNIEEEFDLSKFL